MVANLPFGVTEVADTVRLALAPVFLLSGIGAFLNVCASRLSRIVDRSRDLERLLDGSHGQEHERWLREIRIIDQRMSYVSSAITFAVLSGVMTCLVVALLFGAAFADMHIGGAIALLFIAAMVAIAMSFSVFLIETRLGARSVRIPREVLNHSDLDKL